MAISFVEGDLFESRLGALAHGCNCQGAMGKGIALRFRSKYPAMYAWYKHECAIGRFNLGDVQVWSREPDGPVIFNLATQLYWGHQADLIALERSMRGMCKYATEHKIAKIGLPRIGAGLGGLPWDQVKEVMIKVSRAYPEVDLIVYIPKGTK
jgi:O-acetyl-ADP-ribose deacetylase (regulator of RNase III)